MSVTPFVPHKNKGPFYGGVDAGGTKFLCAIGRTHSQIERVISIPTGSRQSTLSAVASFFNEWIAEGRPLSGLGISSFGPIVRDAADPDYGMLRNSPKLGWDDADIGGLIRRNVLAPSAGGDGARKSVPLAIDTDVNGAALAEGCWGAASGRDIRHYAYVTVGTGVGVGIVANGELVNGMGHPELGHYRPRRASEDRFVGACARHQDCLEGLVSGPAIAERTGRPAHQLSDDDPVWERVAEYLAHLCTVLLLALAPQRIIFGGGVMGRSSMLLPMIRRATAGMLDGYLSHRLHSGDLSEVIVASGLVLPTHDGLSINAGVLGGFILAQKAAGHRDI